MFAALMAITLLSAMPAATQTDRPAVLVAAAEQVRPSGDLHEILKRKFDEMNAHANGIFHEDVTSLVEPFFPLGESYADVEATIRTQHLGTMRPFMGTNDPGMGKMFVTKFSLMSEMFSDISVIIDFDFDGDSKGAMVLKKRTAFVQAANM